MAKNPEQLPPLVIRLTDTERRHLEQQAAAAVLPLSTWARSQLLTSTGYLPPKPKRHRKPA